MINYASGNCDKQLVQQLANLGHRSISRASPAHIEDLVVLLIFNEG